MVYTSVNIYKNIILYTLWNYILKNAFEFYGMWHISIKKLQKNFKETDSSTNYAVISISRIPLLKIPMTC